MQRTQQEVQGAAQARSWNQLEQTPIINYDALGTAALINSALSVKGASPPEYKTTLEHMQTLAAKLSFNTLVPWLHGATLLVGTEAQCQAVFAGSGKDPNGTDPAGKAFFAQMFSGGQPTEWLRALRRSNGNDWDASLSAAAFLEAKKLSLQRESVFAHLPKETYADGAAGIGMYRGTI